MPELLLEILSEEIPARMQARAADDLKRLISDGLKDAGLPFDNARAFVTPRRLVFVADGIPENTPDISEERRGPRADAPEQAINGFKGSLPEGAVVEERETPKGTFLFAKVEIKGSLAAEAISVVINKTIEGFQWPKSMRWSGRTERWVRPMQGIVALFGGEVVSCGYAGVESGRTTVGHRFLSSGTIEVADFADYEAKLRAAHVLIDRDERKQVIKAGAEKLAADAGLSLRDDAGLLDEVSGLVEWPVPLLGSIDDDYMDLPPEVLVTTMRANQKYFVCEDAVGNLANRFVITANMTGADDNIIAGNERVLRARLADAKFFWDQDRAVTLESRLPDLEDITFHAKLGTVAQKTARMGSIVDDLAAFVPGLDVENAKQAASLAKADLVSGMVYEFPEVQGVMGRYYALHEGLDAAVAEALADHYSPLGPSDNCPTAPVSVAVALADKLDTLVGFWAIDEKPTGSKDPYALRRAALGVIRLIVENTLRLPLVATFDAVKQLHGNGGLEIADNDGLTTSLLGFFADRLKVHLREQGVRHDLVDAVFATGDEDDLVRLLARVDALKDFLATDDGANLLAAYKRAANILRIEEKKDGKAFNAAVDPAKIAEDAERALFDGLEALTPDLASALADEDYAGAMGRVATLRPLVDAFFDAVTVNADDAAIRENRLNMLAAIRRALDPIADFSKIEG